MMRVIVAPDVFAAEFLTLEVINLGDGMDAAAGGKGDGAGVGVASTASADDEEFGGGCLG